MSNNCNNEQVKRDGTGREQRFLPPLDTSIPLLDDRGPEDILIFAKRYAELVRFYEINEHADFTKPVIGKSHDENANQPGDAKKTDGTWKDFFNKDIAVVVASIAQYKNKLDALKQEYDDLRKESDKHPNIGNYRNLFSSIIAGLTRINKWYNDSVAGHPLKNELEIKIRSTLAPALQKLIAFGKGYTTLREGKLGVRELYDLFKEDPWNIVYDDIKADEAIYTGNNRDEKVVNASLYVDDAFLAMLKIYKELTERSEFYFKAAIENYPVHQPHMALFISFIGLFTYAQNELNGITKRHLEFYYRDVLHLHERAANPDAVYLIYELAKEATEYVLEEGRPVTAGKDGTGKELIYKTETELVINKAKVKELKTVFQDKEKVTIGTSTREVIKNIYAASVANSEDGNGFPFKVPDTAWPALGYFKPQVEVAADGENVTLNIVGKEAEIGFAIASPQLFLAEGVRKIIITFDLLREGPAPISLPLLNGSLKIQLTGEKEWLTINESENNISDETIKGYLITGSAITVNIPVSESPVAAYNKKIHDGEYETKYPLIKFILTDSSKYDPFKEVFINNQATVIRVDVTGVKTLALSNGDGPIDPTKPFDPFSQTPGPGSPLYIRNREIFSKRLGEVELSLKRKLTGLSPEQLEDLLSGLIGNHPALHCELSMNNQWRAILQTPDLGFFTDKLVITNGNTDPEILSFTRDVENYFSEEPDKRGLKLTLHAYTEDDGEFTNNDGIFSIALLKDPVDAFNVYSKLKFLFELSELAIDYTSVQNMEAGIEQIFHIYPFGVVEIFVRSNFPQNSSIKSFDEYDKARDNNVVNTDHLLPQIRFGNNGTNLTGINQYFAFKHQQGNLFIGIEELLPPQNLSLLFKIADGTAEDNDSMPPPINWSYLFNNEWRPLSAENIISDSTYGLQTTGIILFDFPADATNNNTLITKGLHWLCASVDAGADRIPKLIDVIAQANKAIFFDQENDPEHFRNPLPAKTISKLATKAAEVKTITQPFESFDGKMREEGKVFYARASERLRHKHRAITPWDYEHLVLQHFPWIYKVKCITHTDPGCICRHGETDPANPCCCYQVAPGHVLIVPISNLKNRNAVDILKPRTGRRTLIQIQEYLQKLAAAFVHVHVKNPKFEEIKTSFKVKFYTGTDKGRYLKQLNDDIIKFLSPWAFDETKEIIFGGTIYASNIINFIEELDYVDYITCFRMIHIVDGCCPDDTLVNIDCPGIKGANLDWLDKTGKKLGDRLETEIEASSPQAILTSVKKHCIELIDEPTETDDCNCGH